MIRKIVYFFIISIICLLLIFIVIKLIYIFYFLLPIFHLSVIKQIGNGLKNEWQLKTEAEMEARFNK